MLVGVTLPTFRDDAYALEAARRAEELGFDGVFCFDHLWPLGQPARPALSAFPVLGAVAAATERVHLGPLVARVGLVPDEVMVARFRSLANIAPDRLIAGIGTGDRKSASENLAYGIPPGAPDERRLALRAVAQQLADTGVPVWVGGGAKATTEIAVDLNPRVAVNLWDAPLAAVSSLAASCEVTWGGPIGEEVAQMARRMSELRGAGATWVVCVWPKSIEAVAEARASVSRPEASAPTST